MTKALGNKKLRLAVFGTGWWSKFQIPAWIEAGNLEIVALYNRTVSKAQAAKEKWNLSCNVYSEPEDVFKNEQIDFIDIITETPFHKTLVIMAAKYGIPVVCQKPVAYTYEDCLEMMQECSKAGIPFVINENYRWISTIRQIKKIIESGRIGTPFRCVINLSTGGPYELQNQPFLKTLRHYVLFDLGVHGFDVSRYLFGEPDRVYCQSLRTAEFLKGDDFAVATLTYKDIICNVHLTDMFTTKIIVEGLKGLIELTTDYKLRIITKEEGIKESGCIDWKRYQFMEPEDEEFIGTDVADAIVQAQKHIVDSLRNGTKAETDISEYIKTMEITFAAIKSTLTGESTILYRF